MEPDARELMLKMEQIIRQQVDITFQQHKLNTDMEKVLALLQGNELDKSDTGLIGEVLDHAKRIKKIEDFKARGIAGLIGLSAGAGWGLADFIKRMFTKNHL